MFQHIFKRLTILELKTFHKGLSSSYCVCRSFNHSLRVIKNDLFKNTMFSSPSYYYSTSFLNSRDGDKKLLQYLNALKHEFEDLEKKLFEVTENSNSILRKRFTHLKPITLLHSELEQCRIELKELENIISDSEMNKDQDMLKIASVEKNNFLSKIEELKATILELLIPEAETNNKDLIIELTAGVGGQEAMLFTKEMFDMYLQYAAFRGWSTNVIKYEATGIGGLHHGHLEISGPNAYKMLKYESGVHRVQRIPKTEKAGRVHTSTVTVAVLPQPDEIDIVFGPKDVEMVFKRSSGAGGQHVNKTDSCVRLVHIPTGIMVECQEERCQHRNRDKAFKSLRSKLYQLQLEKACKEEQMSRKLMVGTAARSDKVRTYNYPQDRISDHRIQQNLFNLEIFMQGTNLFDNLLEKLQVWSKTQFLNEMFQKC